MIRKGWEVTIFIIIFIVTGLVLLPSILRWKASMPINAGMTEIEVIEQRYKQVEENDCEYEYITKGDYLFVFVEAIEDNATNADYIFDVGYKNSQSGYILRLPGASFGDFYEYESEVVTLEHGEVLSLEIRRYFQSDYVIIAKGRNVNGISFFVDDREMEALSFKSETRWLDVLDESLANYEIYAMYKGERIDIISYAEINRLFMGADYDTVD